MLGIGQDIVIEITANVTQAAAALTALRGELNSMATSTLSAASSAAGSMRKIGNSMVGAGGVGTAMFTLPLLFGLQNVTEAGMEFDQWLIKTASLYPTAEIEELKQELKDLAFELGSTTKFSATEAMEAMYALGQAGFEVKDMYEILPAAISLATAQNYDLESSMRMIISTINAFKDLDIDDVGRVSNVFAAAMTASQGSMEDLEDGVKYLLPTFSAMGYSIEDAVGLMSKLLDISYKGQNAGRILRDSISDLVNPTGEAKKVLEEYGIQLYTNQEAMNAASAEYSAAEQSLNEMKDAYDELSTSILEQESYVKQLKRERENIDQTQDQYSYDLYTDMIEKEMDKLEDLREQKKYDNNSIKEQSKLIDELGKAYDGIYAEGLLPITEILAQLKDMPMGVLDTIFGKQSGAAIKYLAETLTESGISERIEEITDTVEAERQAAVQAESASYKLTIAMQALDTVKVEVFYAISDALVEFANFITENKDIISEFFSSLATYVVPILIDVVEQLVGLMKWFKGLPEPIQQTITKMLATGIVALAMLGPILLIGGALAWSAANVVELGVGLAGFVGIGGAATTTAEGLGAGLGGAGLMGVLTTLVNAAVSLAPVIAAIVAGIAILWDQYNDSENFRTSVDNFFNSILAFGMAFAGFWQGIGSGIFDIATDLVEVLGNALIIINDLWDIAKMGNVEGVRDKIQELSDLFGDFFIQGMIQAMTLLKDNLEVLAPACKDLVVATVKLMGSILIDVIPDLIVAIVTTTEAMMKENPYLFAGIFGIIIDTMIDTIVKVFDDNKIAMQTAAVDFLEDTIVSTFNNLINDALSWGGNLIQSFIDGVLGMTKPLTDAMGAVAGIVADHIGVESPTKEGPLQHLPEWAPNLVNEFASGIESSLGMLSGSMNMMAGSVATPIISMPTGNMGGNKTMHFTFDMRGAVIRDDRDIDRLANATARKINENWGFEY